MTYLATVPTDAVGEFDVISDHAGLGASSDAAFWLQSGDVDGRIAIPSPAFSPPAPAIVRPAPPKRVLFMHGFPGWMGGASSEAWHVLRMLVRHGVDIHILATSAEPDWVKRIEDFGGMTIHAPFKHPTNGGISPDQIRDVPGIAGAAVMSFCCSWFHSFEWAEVFRELRCKRIWVGCMNWIAKNEKKLYEQHGAFEAHVFQSEFQRQTLEPQLSQYGYNPTRGHLIRGAFDVNDFPFRPLPRVEGEPFVVGRISRPDGDKFSTNTFPIAQKAHRALESRGGLRLRIMAWEHKTAAKLKNPPPWVDCLKTHAVPSVDFHQSLHCYHQYNGGAKENWPRSGLEAMSTGAPLVVQDAWGWREMVADGVSGMLCGDEPSAPAMALVMYATNEDMRMEHAHAARKRVEQLADPETIWEGWRTLLDSLEG
jgi:hypothetical protein